MANFIKTAAEDYVNLDHISRYEFRIIAGKPGRAHEPGNPGEASTPTKTTGTLYLNKNGGSDRFFVDGEYAIALRDALEAELWKKDRLGISDTPQVQIVEEKPKAIRKIKRK